MLRSKALNLFASSQQVIYRTIEETQTQTSPILSKNSYIDNYRDFIDEFHHRAFFAIYEEVGNYVQNDYLHIGLNAYSNIAYFAAEGNVAQNADRETRIRTLFFSMLDGWCNLLDADEHLKEDYRRRAAILIEEVINRLSGPGAWPERESERLAVPSCMPKEFNEIISAGEPIPNDLLNMALFFMAKNTQDEFIATPCLLYQSSGAHRGGRRTVHSQENEDHCISIAHDKLSRLLPGQKLMIPLLDISNGQAGYEPSNNHYSAALALRIKDGFRFFIFDSFFASNRDDNKQDLLDRLINETSRNEFFYLGKRFQWKNDCGIHIYNFFRLCILAPENVLSSGRKMKTLFNNYINNLEKLKYRLGCDEMAASSLMRIYFVLDCLKSGYTPSCYSDTDLLLQIHALPGLTGVMPKNEPVIIDCFGMLWDRLRRGSPFMSTDRQKRDDSDE